MFIRLISDMHLEFGKDWEPLLPEMPEDSDTVLVAAGDISTGVDACEFLQQVASRFAHVIYVLGNHEFYGNNIDTLADDIREELGDFDNVTLFDNETLVLGDVRFIGSTLWTNMAKENPTVMLIVERGMVDYGHIRRNGGHKLRARDTVALHKEAVSYIEEELAKEHDGPTVVVTHHLPSFKSVHPMFHRAGVNALNPAFYSDLDILMHDYQIDYWLHGHTHATLEYEIAGTKVRMNPFGYSRSIDDLENSGFDPKWRIEL